MPHDIKEETNGRWPGIYQALGIDVGESGNHCGCPICGPGTNNHRFRMDDKEGTGSWICTQCGSGDGFTMIQKVFNVDFKGAIGIINSVIGTADVSKPQPEKKASKDLLRKIYVESSPVSDGDTVHKYLKNRGISVTSDKLRLHPSCYEPETHSKMPAMLATFTLPDGTAITLHRTFLEPTGQKADIRNPKKILPALQKMVGGAIRLFDPVDGVIGITEGIETALAVHEITGLPIWSTVSSTLMEGFIPPVGVKGVLIFADKDSNFAGQKSAYALANKLVIKHNIQVEVRIPNRIGDFLDELNNNNKEK